MEVVDLREVLKKENLEIVVIRGAPSLYQDLPGLLRSNGYTNVNVVDGPDLRVLPDRGLDIIAAMRKVWDRVDTDKELSDAVQRAQTFASEFFVGRSLDVGILNYGNPTAVYLLGPYLVNALQKKQADHVISSPLVVNPTGILKNLDILRARKLFNYDAQGVVSRLAEQSPPFYFQRAVVAMQHTFNSVVEHGPEMLGDSSLWETMLGVYGLAVGLNGDYSELIERLDSIYQLLYDEKLSDGVYESSQGRNLN